MNDSATAIVTIELEICMIPGPIIMRTASRSLVMRAIISPVRFRS